MVVVPHPVFVPHTTPHYAPAEEAHTYRAPITVPHSSTPGSPQQPGPEGTTIALTDGQKRGFWIFMLCMLGLIVVLISIASYQTRGNDYGP